MPEAPRQVLIVHRYFWPENISVLPLMLRDLAALHAGRGESVTVVTAWSGDFTADHARLPPGVTVRGFRAPLDRGGSLARRVWHLLRLGALGARALFGRRWDLVWLTSYPPGLAGPLLLLAKRLGRARHAIFYVQDEAAYRLPGPVRRLWRIYLRGALRLADRVVTLSHEMAAELAAAGAEPARLSVIPNFAPELEATALHAPPPRWDIVYAGNHGTAQNLGHFLRTLAALPEAARPAVAFFGDGAAKPGLIEAAAALGLDKTVRFHDPVPRAEIRQEIAAARFGLVGAQPGLMRHAFPSKLSAYAAEGTPALVMAEAEGPLAAWLRDTGLGAALHPSDPALAARQLREILATPADDGDRSRTRRVAEDVFGKPRYLERMRGLLRGLEGRRRDA